VSPQGNAQTGIAGRYDPCQVWVDALDAKGLRWRGHPYKGVAQCPAHDDTNPSVSFAEGVDGRLVAFCHAGCPIEEIVRALDLQMSDLYPNDHRWAPKSRQPKLVAERPIVMVEQVLEVAGIRWRPTADPQMIVADHCPHCMIGELWIADHGDRVRASCWRGCSSEQVLAALYTRVTGGDRAAA
jgi:hypothetical protein